MKTISVLILTQRDCAFCDTAKAMTDRLSQEYPLSVATLPLDSTDGQALAERGGILFPPGIFLDGEPFCYGRPSERKLRREIERRLSVG
jgi:glutaredoxin